MTFKNSVITVIFLIAILFAMTGSWDDKNLRKVAYDCSLSEISPDYPIEVKEACRKMRAERSAR
jgi:hypothetical protein